MYSIIADSSAQQRETARNGSAGTWIVTGLVLAIASGFFLLYANTNRTQDVVWEIPGLIAAAGFGAIAWGMWRHSSSSETRMFRATVSGALALSAIVMIFLVLTA